MPARDMTISAVVPAFNAEAVLERALDSMLRQTLPPQEILVVDDGSTDSTADVARRFGAPVRCLWQPNQGASAARNTGIRTASCNFVAFLDADDVWTPGHLERSMRIFRSHPDLYWCCAAYERELPGGRRFVRRPDERGLQMGAYFNDYFQLASRWHNHTDTMVIRREVFDEIGTFEPSLATGEDHDLWFRIALRYPRIGYSSEVAALYRYTPGSLMSQGLTTPVTLFNHLRRGEQQAREFHPDGLRRAAPLLRLRAEFAVRQALRSQNRDLLRQFSGLSMWLPFRWRALISLSLRTPAFLWLLGLRGWELLRSTPLRFLWRYPMQDEPSAKR